MKRDLVAAAGVILLAAAPGWTQTPAGSPNLDVILQGTPDAPLVVNQSHHRVLAYMISFVSPNGRRTRVMASFLGELRNHLPSPGIAPGGSRVFQMMTQTLDAAGNSTSSGFNGATITAVVFDSGEIVGPDSTAAYDEIQGRIDGERYVNSLALVNTTSAWLSLAAIAKGQMPPATGSTTYQQQYKSAARAYAGELTRAHEAGRDIAELAQRSSAYPVLTKGGN
jgi:hypothetical protein